MASVARSGMRLWQSGQRVVVLLMGVVMVASARGDGFWNRHNFATTHRRSPGWSLPQQEGSRRSIFARIWEDTSPNNPFLPQRPPTPPPIRPQLSENDFIMEDAYDDDDATDLLWLPQTRFGKPDPPDQHQQDSTSLEGLQHLLEVEVNPVHRPTKVNQVGLEETATHKSDVGTTHNKQTEHRQHLGHGFDPFRRGSGRLDGQALDHTRHYPQLPLINQHFHRQGILSQDHLSKDVPHDYHGHLSLPEQLTNHKHFSQDFISHTPQLLQEYDNSDEFSGDLLTSHRHSQILPQHELFPTNLFGDSRQFPGSFRKHIFSSVDRQDFPDHVTIPEPFINHHTFEDFTHQQPFVEQQQFRELQTSPHEETAGVLPEDEGPAWLPSALSGLNLPSSKDLISVFTNPELTDEDHRCARNTKASVYEAEACHARNLHTCGTRVIDEFSHEPGYQETCRIREEFLDCMEQQRGKPCHLHGKRFSRDGTKLIRDRIKTLLWSARGCILGHSA